MELKVLPFTYSFIYGAMNNNSNNNMQGKDRKESFYL